jgi:LuxR family maltose regulon positive regulatory protein
MGTALPAHTRASTLVFLAEFELARGDRSSAQALVEVARKTLADDDKALLLFQRMIRVQNQAMGIVTYGDPATLTTAELRVLRLLSTHLSLGEIGRTLFVSRNTIKSQVISIYRKLGVSGRSQAVELAKAYGLTPHDNP